MSLIFINYSTKNRDVVRLLAEDLETANHRIWFDYKLIGGQTWWDEILENIRLCDLFLFALTPESLDSHPVYLEFQYAYQLNKNILPVLLTGGVNIGLLPPPLAEIQYVDYRDRDARAAIRLMNALQRIPPPKPLPEPLPEPPPSPISYLVRLKERIATPGPLKFEEQIALVFQLKDRIRVGDETVDALALLRLMKKRADLDAAVDKEIDTLLSTPDTTLLSDQSPARQNAQEVRPDHPPQQVRLHTPGHIFLSYSHKDTDVMQRARADLQSRGLAVWTDEGIEPGTTLWKDAIAEAIEGALCFVVILSPEAKQSIWVRRELEFAEIHKLRRFALLARGDERDAIPFALAGSQHVDIRTNYDTGIQQLVAAIAKHVV